MSYYQDDDYLAYEDEVGNYYYLCRWFEVIRTEKKLETGSDTVFLKCITKSGEKEYSIPSQDMANSQFHKHLMNFGLMISNGDRETVDTILNYAYYSKEYAPYIQTYDSLGFFTSGEETMFLGNSIINVYDKTVKYEGYSYISPDKVLKKGSLKEWVKGVRKLTERTEIALALAIGSSAPITYRLHMLGLFKETPIFAFIGRSSTGKTSMLKLMASIWGSPNNGEGVIDLINNTKNYFYESLTKRHGFPLFIDETSSAIDEKFTDIIYNVSLGKGRGRLKSSGEMKSTGTGSTTLVYTGETSLFDQTNRNQGLYARLIELENKWLPEDPQVTKLLYDTVMNNYGMAWKRLLYELMAIDDATFEAMYKDTKEKISAKLTYTDQFTDRIIARLAIIGVSLSTCNKCWNLVIDEDAVLDMLLANCESIINPDVGIPDYLDKIWNQIVQANGKFANAVEGRSAPSTIWGKYSYFDGKPCIWIQEQKMLEFAKYSGIPDFKSLHSNLADKGFLIRDKSGHYILRRKLGSAVACKCYGVYLPETTEENSEAQDVEEVAQSGLKLISASKPKRKFGNKASESQSEADSEEGIEIEEKVV